MSNCREISTYCSNFKYYQLLWITLSIFIIIPWTLPGFYTCIKNLRTCTNTECNVDTEINKREVQKVYIYVTGLNFKITFVSENHVVEDDVLFTNHLVG